MEKMEKLIALIKERGTVHDDISEIAYDYKKLI